jgi:hypothetical protein
MREKGLKEISWNIRKISHEILDDGFNCGIYVSFFLESLLSDQVTSDEIKTTRKLESMRMRILALIYQHQYE